MAQPHTDKVAELVRFSAALDRLIRDVQLGHPSHRESERQADEMRRIGTGLDALGRKPTAPVHPPIGKIGTALVW